MRRLGLRWIKGALTVDCEGDRNFVMKVLCVCVTLFELVNFFFLEIFFFLLRHVYLHTSSSQMPFS